jgi:hypothetical protein
MLKISEVIVIVSFKPNQQGSPPMQPWQQRTITYSLFLLVASTIIGVKYHIPFFIEVASAVGFNSALVGEEQPAVDPFKTPEFLALKAKAETGDPQACLFVARQYKMSWGGDLTTANQWYIIPIPSLNSVLNIGEIGERFHPRCISLYPA